MPEREQYWLEFVEEEGKPAHWQMVIELPGGERQVVSVRLQMAIQFALKQAYLIPVCDEPGWEWVRKETVSGGLLFSTAGFGPGGAIEFSGGVEEAMALLREVAREQEFTLVETVG